MQNHTKKERGQARANVHEAEFCSELSALSDITHIKNTILSKIMFFQRLLELLGRLKDILFSKYPSAPVHAQCLFALGVFENTNSIMGVRVCWAENMTRSVCSNGDQAEIKWTPELTYLLEGRTYGEIVLGIPIIFPFWQLVHCPVTGITGWEVSKA